MSTDVEQHYDRLAATYDEFLSYSPDFVPRLASKMIDMLRLEKSDRLVDLGCGSGMYSLEILRQMPLQEPIVGVDPCLPLLERIAPGGGIVRRHADALAFSEEPGRYDKVLIKETVHHVEDRGRLFRNLFERLVPGGVLLLVHVPPKLDYPLFRKALERCERWHADPNELEALLGETGFQVERDALDYRHQIPKERYFSMVAARYMSVLSSFEEREIAEGLAEMEERYADRITLSFNDHFDYIAGRKP